MFKNFHIKRSLTSGGLLLTGISVLVICYIVYSWVNYKNERASYTLQIARSIASVYPKDDLKNLDVGPSDLEKPAYLALKKALAAAIKANPEARFAYIYVEINGKIYFVADSEPEDSEDYSPPGQEYTEAKAEDFQPFRDGKETITPALSDRWGTWRSVLIPVNDEATGQTIAVFGMDFNAQSWNSQLIFNLIQSAITILLLFVFIVVNQFQNRNKLLQHEITERKKIETELKNSLDHNKALLGANPDMMFIFDSDGRITDYHSESIDQLIVTPDLFHGKTLEGIFPPEIVTTTNDKIKAVLSTGQAQYSTYELQLNGKLMHFESRYVAAGQNRVLSIVRDISEKKQAEDALRLSEERLRLSLSAANQGLYDLNVQTGDAVVNDEYASMLGYDPKTFVETNASWIKRLHPDDGLNTSKAYQDYIAGKTEEYRVEFRQKTANNDWKWILSVGKIVELDPEGKPLRMLGTHVDITDRKMAEKALQKSEKQWRKLVQTLPDFVALYDLNDKYIFLNHFAEGFSMEDIEGKTYTDFLSEDSKPLYEKAFQTAKQTNTTQYVEHIAFGDNRTLRHYESYFVPIFENDVFANMLVIARDITDRKKMEESILQEQLFSKSLIDSLPGIFYLYSYPEMKLIRINKNSESILGFKNEELLNKTIYELHRPELQKVIKETFETVIETGQSHVEVTLNTKDGKPIRFLMTGVKIEFEDQIFVMGIGIDISEREIARDLLKKEEEKYRMLTENMKDVVWIIDTHNLAFTYLSPSVQKLRGFTPEEVMAMPVESSFLQEDVDNLKLIMGQRIHEFINNPAIRNKFFADEMQQPCKDGTNVWIEAIYQYYLNPETSHIEMRGVSRDISDRKKAEAEIKLYNEKLINLNATKDKFFSIIAHDLRSPFNSFMGMTQIMAEEIQSLTMKQVQEIAVSMSKSASNLYRLLENLLQWSLIQQKGMTFRPENIDLHKLVNDSILMVQESAILKKIEITNAVPEGLNAFADTNAIQTVIRNLVSNSIKYTKSGGAVTISAQLEPNGFIETSVQDTGIGMSPSMIETLFRLDVKNSRPGTEGEPSSGLGLLLCKEFVEKNGGKIRVESEVGKGSIFIFALPQDFTSEVSESIVLDF